MTEAVGIAVAATPDVKGLLEVVKTITADLTLSVLDDLVYCDASSGAITVTLPAASGNSGRPLRIKKIDSSANTVTIDGNGSETIDDGLTAVLTDQYESVDLVCDGANWYIA